MYIYQKTSEAIVYYWDGDVAQVDGNRGAELAAHNFIGRLITDYIFTNTVYTALNVDVTQVTDIAKVYESAAATKILVLSGNTVSVIANGLSSMPVFEQTGIGYIKIQGKWDTSSLLLITNTSNNEIIYNFSQVTTGGKVTIKDHGKDTDFATYPGWSKGSAPKTFGWKYRGSMDHHSLGTPSISKYTSSFL